MLDYDTLKGILDINHITFQNFLNETIQFSSHVPDISIIKTINANSCLCLHSLAEAKAKHILVYFLKQTVLYFLLKFTENNLEYCLCIYYASKAINMVAGNVIPERIRKLTIQYM